MSVAFIPVLKRGVPQANIDLRCLQALTLFYPYSERSVSRLQLTSDLCDLTIPVSALAWTNLDDGLVGLAGTVSSLIGLYFQWKKTA